MSPVLPIAASGLFTHAASLPPHAPAQPFVLDGSRGASSPLLAAATLLLPTLERGAALDARILRSAMEGAFGASGADGAWVWKDAYEAAEAASVLFLLKYGPTMHQQARHSDGTLDTLALLKQFERLAALLPSHTRRSEESIALQQFSTPLPLAFVAAHAAGIRRGETALEPSCGTGLLAIHARPAGARLWLNELDAGRAALAGGLYGAIVTRHDAATIDDRLDPSCAPSVVLMNPPFSVGANIEGKWKSATLAHVRSALARLAPGGRLVTITGSGFSPYAPQWRDAFVRLQETATLRLAAPIAGSLYARHGTTTETRLTVLDKVPAPDQTSFHAPFAPMASSEQLLKLVTAYLPARDGNGIDETASTAALTPLSKLAHCPNTFPAPAAERRFKVDPAAFALLSYVVRDIANTDGNGANTAAADGHSLGEGLYETYPVQRIAIAGARDHPTVLVQSAAMASVVPPAPSYRPILPIRLVTDGLLSGAQLESVVYAGEAHGTHLSDYYTVHRSLDRVDHAAGAGDAPSTVCFRRGWFLGDGAGAGKGRQVAGVIMDNWLQGRRRAVWVSKSDKLIEDAMRDWTALGGAKSDVVPLSGFRQGSRISLTEGILFMTYATLRTQAKGEKVSRVEQIAEWLQPSDDDATVASDSAATPSGHDAADENTPLAFPTMLFNGCLVFDEAHAMANAAAAKGSRGAQKASQQGLAGLRLQNALPDARVLYVSATGATTVANLAYASRLGLWGTGDFPFATREAFVAAMEKSGVAAMEVISRDLKSLGLYAARSLSYDGVEYDTLVHELTEGQRRIYDSYADAFQIIHQNLDAAMEASGITSDRDGTLNAQAKSAARSAFESAKQRFFNHLLTSMKCPSLIASMERELAAGHACVVQVVSTGEALMERRLTEIPADQWGDLDVDVTHREYVLDYLAHSFPVQLFETYSDDDGNLRSRPAADAPGNPIACRDAEARRNELIDYLGSLPAVNGAIDQLLWHFGTEAVAEVTGRSRRVVRKDAVGGKGGRLAIEGRPASSNYGETNAFMDEDKRVLVFADAGGIGRSYHADLNAKNQRRRVHFLLEPGWKADNAIQDRGRTNRTNQKQAPLFRLVTTDVKGEKRFVSTIARRLDTLGAITKGQRQTGGQGIFSSSDNLESVYARAALRRFFFALTGGRIDGCSLEDFEETTGLSLLDQDGSVKEDLPLVTQFLNRMLALRIDMQNRLFDAFGAILNGLIDQAKAGGTFDVGVEMLKADRFEIVERKPIFAHKSGAEAIALTIRRTDRTDVMDADRAAGFARASLGKTVVNARSGRAAVVTSTTPWTDENGMVIERVKLTRPAAKETMTLEKLVASEWKEADEQLFKEMWAKEVAEVPEFVTDAFTLVTGLLLPIWDALPTDDMKVWHVTAETSDGGTETVLGRAITREELTSVLRRLGHEVTVEMSGADLSAAIMDRHAVVTLTNGTTLRCCRQMGEKRIEVIGAEQTLVR